MKGHIKGHEVVGHLYLTGSRSSDTECIARHSDTLSAAFRDQPVCTKGSSVVVRLCYQLGLNSKNLAL